MPSNDSAGVTMRFDEQEKLGAHAEKKKWWDVWGKWKEGQESDWWFASTGIP